MKQIENLLKEIEIRRTEYRTIDYSMSIGELTNLYKNSEIIIDPDFQRFFRWSPQQKTKLIESILLGIPIPPIFVFQRDDGIWEVVDGLQRVSTILQFFGILKGYKRLILEETKYIPSLEGIVYEPKGAGDIELPPSLKLFLKRAKLNFVIILQETGHTAKYEVFQRLNTGGTNATNQEIRNSLMVMINKPTFDWFNTLANNSDFQNCISISERLTDQQYHLELALKYVTLINFEYNRKKEYGDYLDGILEQILADKDFPYESIQKDFEKTFNFLNGVLGDDSFKKFTNGSFKGKFLDSSFEAVSVGIGSNINNYSLPQDTDWILSRIMSLYLEKIFIDNTGSGSTAKTRIPKIIPFVKLYFRKNV